jgi:L-lactate dehydrogenase complex protein LldF
MPRAYRLATEIGARALKMMSRGGRLRLLPLAGGWTNHRDLPAPQGRSFQSQWAARR